jgi:hypothetical protein
MAIARATHWFTPISGVKMSLRYEKGRGYLMTGCICQKRYPGDPATVLPVIPGGTWFVTLVECNRQSSKREKSAIELFDTKVKEFIDSHPAEE